MVIVVVVDVGCAALGCLRARVDDVSKSRRLGLVGLPRDLPFSRALIYARSGVTLAPALFAAAACQIDGIDVHPSAL